MSEITGVDGGFAREALRLEPWSSFPALGSEHRVFQDMTVFDILDVVFGSHAGRARQAPAWRLEVADHSLHPRRSLTTQYEESDLAFVERLLREEGLCYSFESPGNPAAGGHTLVIARKRHPTRGLENTDMPTTCESKHAFDEEHPHEPIRYTTTA